MSRATIMRAATTDPTLIPTLADVESWRGGLTGYGSAKSMLSIAAVVVVTVGVGDVEERVSVIYRGGGARSVVRVLKQGIMPPIVVSKRKYPLYIGQFISLCERVVI
jgi:hypothetical protein